MYKFVCYFSRITNLKYFGHSEQIIRKTLTLLNDLTLTFSSIRRLIKLDEIQFMLNNHTVIVIFVLF